MRTPGTGRSHRAWLWTQGGAPGRCPGPQEAKDGRSSHIRGPPPPAPRGTGGQEDKPSAPASSNFCQNWLMGCFAGFKAHVLLCAPDLRICWRPQKVAMACSVPPHPGPNGRRVFSGASVLWPEEAGRQGQKPRAGGRRLGRLLSFWALVCTRCLWLTKQHPPDSAAQSNTRTLLRVKSNRQQHHIVPGGSREEPVFLSFPDFMRPPAPRASASSGLSHVAAP